MSDAPHDVLERAAELDRLRVVLADARDGRGRVVVVQGEAGIGKTRLLEAARDLAGPSTLCLTARGTALERDYPFGVVRQLFEGTLGDRAGRAGDVDLTGASALAGPVFTHVRADVVPQPPGDALSSLHGLYWLLSDLAEQTPVVLLVDDAHWADSASLRYLAYLGTRIADLRVALVVATRPGEADDLLDQVLADPDAEQLRPQPLTEPAVARLVAAAFDDRVEPEFVCACSAATGGNPFLLRALIGELVDRRVRPVASAVDRVERTSPQTVSLAIQVRLRRLPTGDRDVARALAVLGGEAGLREVAELAGVRAEAAAMSVDRLAGAGICESVRPLRFTHPIVGTAVGAGTPPALRAAAHARAARLCDARDATSEQVALHLLAVEPAGDDWALQHLRAAAAQAVERGAPRAAVRFLERALAEPPAPEQRFETLAALGSVEAHLGSPRAIEHLREALDQADTSYDKLPIVVDCSAVLSAAGQIEQSIELLEQMIDSLDDTDDALGLELEAQLGVLLRMQPSVAGGAGRRTRFRVPSQPTGRTVGERLLLAEAAFAHAMSGGKADEVAAQAELAFATAAGLWPRQGKAAASAMLNVQALYVLIVTDRFERADQVLSTALQLAAREVAAMPLTLALGWSSHLAFRRGAITEAEDCARRALALVRQHGWRGWEPMVLAFLVDALVAQGRQGDASRQLVEGGFGGAIPDGIAFNFLLEARAGLRLSCAAWETGLDDLRDFASREAGRRAANVAMSDWRSRAALALAATGEGDQARRLACDAFDLARGFGAVSALGAALRVAGLVHEGEARLGHLYEADSVLATAPARLEHARARADLGSELRRRGGRRREAVEMLQSAYAAASACGASLLADQIRGELQVAGARPRRAGRQHGPESLTPSERRVAAMAQQGLANRDIAQALFVSLKTVEMHLSHTYAKLGIGSRAELAGALRAVPVIPVSVPEP